MRLNNSMGLRVFIILVNIICPPVLAQLLGPHEQDIQRFTKISSGEKISVIVRLKQPLPLDTEKSRAALQHVWERKSTNYEQLVQKRTRFDEKDPRLARLINRLGKQKFNRKMHHFRDPNLKSFSVGVNELKQLLSDSEVEVFANHWNKPMLASSMPIVFPDYQTADFDGSGWAVALIDTGVDFNHTFIAGSNTIQAAAACFSNDNNSGSLLGGVSLCPGGIGIAYGSSTGDACDSAISGCSHGTKMAGIISGTSVSNKGVAQGASVISIQVYSKSTDEIVCGVPENTPCIGALDTDIIRALDYVYDIASSRSIAAVNMSFGSTAVFQSCDHLPIKTQIDELRAKGVASVVATGNLGETISVSSPACVGSAIAVAATNDSDIPWSGNNRGSVLDLFAPGVGVTTSSLPVSTFVSATGTSIATAFVSGAFAVLRSKHQTATVATLEGALKSSGVSVIQGALVRSRINITSALALLPETVLPETVLDDELCFPIKSTNGNVSLICL